MVPRLKNLELVEPLPRSLLPRCDKTKACRTIIRQIFGQTHFPLFCFRGFLQAFSSIKNCIEFDPRWRRLPRDQCRLAAWMRY